MDENTSKIKATWVFTGLASYFVFLLLCLGGTIYILNLHGNNLELTRILLSILIACIFLAILRNFTKLISIPFVIHVNNSSLSATSIAGKSRPFDLNMMDGIKGTSFVTLIPNGFSDVFYLMQANESFAIPIGFMTEENKTLTVNILHPYLQEKQILEKATSGNNEYWESYFPDLKGPGKKTNI